MRPALGVANKKKPAAPRTTTKAATTKAATTKGATTKGATTKAATTKAATTKAATTKGVTTKGATTKSATTVRASTGNVIKQDNVVARKVTTRKVLTEPRKEFLAAAKFADLPIDAGIRRALAEVFRYEYMSKPQAMYMLPALSGKDVFVKARTGSGKTLGFLIPAVESLLRRQVPAGKIRALILSPSRELADQTRREAERLLKFLPQLGAQMVIGGVNQKQERARLARERCDMLVATPGRLQDHIESTPGFKERFDALQVLILDEADRLLDMGFAPAIRRIISIMPQVRQTLLYTATVPAGVQQVADAFMRKERVFVNTAGEDGDEGKPSHARIKQESMVLPIPQLLPALHGILMKKRQERPRDHKIIVFAPTALMAQLLSELMRVAGMPEALELHSRLSQGQRNAVTQAFAKGTGMVLFASDVIARGIDFPDVTLVVQLGLTDVQQYEHRVGRTGRAGKSGEAVIILGDDAESRLLNDLKKAGMQITPAATSNASSSDPLLTAAIKRLGTPGSELNRTARRAFSASLGFYNSHMKRLGWKPVDMVAAVIARFRAAGLTETPAIAGSTLSKMHLRGVPGIVEDTKARVPSSKKFSKRPFGFRH